jgi:hypothetical protein
MSSRAQDADPAGGVFDHREDVVALPGQGDRGDDVDGQEGVGLTAQEIGPRAGCSVGCGIDARGPEDLLHGRRVPPFHQVAVPAQDCVRSDEQLQPAQCLAGQGVQEGGQQRPVDSRERHRARVEVALQYGELMTQGETSLSRSLVGRSRRMAKVLVTVR